MPVKHNKKRNVGLISEFFARYIASAFIENRHDDIAKANHIWKKYVNPKTETYKELVMFNALSESSFKSREIAYSLLQKVKNACSKQSQARLDQEKESLINEVKASLKDQEFFDRPVVDYKAFASIQVLMNAWRGIGFKGPLQELSLLEESVLESLLLPKKNVSNFEIEAQQLTSSEVDNLVVKIMTEKFNSKYENSLNEQQKNLVRLYALGNKRELLPILESIKEKTLKYSKSSILTENLDVHTKKKINEVVGLVMHNNPDFMKGDLNKLNDELIVFYMSLSRLHEEMESEDK